MSKQLPLTTSVDDVDAPPSYAETVSLAPSANTLTSLLSNLPAQVRQTQKHLVDIHRDQDNLILHAILPHVETFLSSPDIATAPSRVSELILIPESAVQDSWSLTGLAERQSEGDVVRVARVRFERSIGDGEKTQSGVSSWGHGKGFTEPSHNWWTDEGLARRLAGYLQPKEVAKIERRDVRAEIEQKKKEKGGLFGFGRKRSELSSTLSSPQYNSQIEKKDDGVVVRATAEEVTFRKENDFGIWESMSGFGIIVRVRVRKTLKM